MEVYVIYMTVSHNIERIWNPVIDISHYTSSSFMVEFALWP